MYMYELYLMVGKEFETIEELSRIGGIRDLNEALAKYELISNLSEDFDEEGSSDSIRRLSDPVGTERYVIVSRFSEDDVSAAYECPSGLCIGKVIYNKEVYQLGDLLTIESSKLSELEKALKEVKEDIPDAEILLFLSLRI